MYKNGELDRVMAEFEKGLKTMPIYVGGGVDRADKFDVIQPDGRISRQYKNSNYYNKGNVNSFFILYLHGYAMGKCEGRMECA